MLVLVMLLLLLTGGVSVDDDGVHTMMMTIVMISDCPYIIVISFSSKYPISYSTQDPLAMDSPTDVS